MCPRRSNGVALLMSVARLAERSQREQQRSVRAKNRNAYPPPTMVPVYRSFTRFDQVDNMDGAAFEYYVADLLRKNGFQNVWVTKESGDYGVDVVAHKNGESYAFQCKCYHGSVGVKSIQEVYAGATFYNLHQKVVVTNSRFTKSAYVMAQRLGVQLWDRNTLIRLMRTQSSVQGDVNKSKKKVALVVLIVIGAVIHFTLFVSALNYTPEESVQPVPSQRGKTSASAMHTGRSTDAMNENNDETTEHDKPTEDLPIYSSREAPIRICDYDLVNTIETDLDAAVEKYQGEWVEITGEVASVDVGKVGVLTYDDGRQFTVGESQYTVNGITVKSGLFYWLNDRAHANTVQIIIEMNYASCDVYYEQGRTVTVVGRCVSIDEDDVVIRYGVHAN